MFLGKQTSVLRRAIAILLLSLVCSLLVNNIAYLHTHLNSDGTYISHAHPYDTDGDSAPIKNHQHKKFEYSIIDALQFFIIATTLVIAIISTKAIRHFIQIEIGQLCTISTSYYLRGPPSLA